MADADTSSQVNQLKCAGELIRAASANPDAFARYETFRRGLQLVVSHYANKPGGTMLSTQLVDHVKSLDRADIDLCIARREYSNAEAALARSASNTRISTQRALATAEHLRRAADAVRPAAVKDNRAAVVRALQDTDELRLAQAHRAAAQKRYMYALSNAFELANTCAKLLAEIDPANTI